MFIILYEKTDDQFVVVKITRTFRSFLSGMVMRERENILIDFINSRESVSPVDILSIYSV